MYTLTSPYTQTHACTHAHSRRIYSHMRIRPHKTSHACQLRAHIKYKHRQTWHSVIQCLSKLSDIQYVCMLGCFCNQTKPSLNYCELSYLLPVRPFLTAHTSGLPWAWRLLSGFQCWELRGNDILGFRWCKGPVTNLWPAKNTTWYCPTQSNK